MSTRSSFREALARRDATEADRPNPSASRVRLLLRADGDLTHPVGFARTLVGFGVALRRAHALLDRLAAREAVAVEIGVDDPARAVDALARFGIRAAPMMVPEISVREVRERSGLSQADFAMRFGLELRTIQNWEQDRNGLDATARVLMAVIAHDPRIVEAALTAPPDEPVASRTTEPFALEPPRPTARSRA